MRRHARYQLVLDLGGGRRPQPSEPAPGELLKALADLLLEALGDQTNAIAADREACDAFQDRT